MNGLVLDFWGKYSTVILDMGRRILIAILIFIGGRLVIFLGSRIISKASTSKLKLDETIATILKMVLTYATVIICVIMILDDFGFNTTGLIAILGTAGVAIGFALQGTLTNIAFGIIILFLKPFRNGDFVEFGPNMGQVKKIGIQAFAGNPLTMVNIGDNGEPEIGEDAFRIERVNFQ